MIRNIVLTVLFCVVLSSPLLLAVSECALKDHLPSWLSNEDASYLLGNAEQANIRAVSSIACFMSGSLQQELEREIGNHIPARSKALLANAGMQFEAIRFSNMFFDWDCIPTSFGSNFIVASIGGDHRLLEMPQIADREGIASYAEMASKYESFASEHPNIRLYLYIAPDSQNVSDSPALDLFSNPFSYTDMHELLAGDDPPRTRRSMLM